MEITFTIMDKLQCDTHRQAMIAAFVLKEYQRNGIFASVDSVIYHMAGNTLSIDHVDTRATNPPPSWIRKMIEKDGFPQSMRMECNADADDSTTSALSETMDSSSINPPPSLNATKNQQDNAMAQSPKSVTKDRTTVTEAADGQDVLEMLKQIPGPADDEVVERRHWLVQQVDLSNQDPRHCSTPDGNPTQGQIDSKALDILSKLDDVQKICTTAIKGVEHLRDSHEKEWAEIPAIRVRNKSLASTTFQSISSGDRPN